MADSQVVLGIAGIVGTLSGVLALNGTTLFVEHRKRLREDVQRRAELRKAARLVHTELAEATATIETAIATKRPWTSSTAPSRASWLEHQPLLASSLKQDEYRFVSYAYVQLKADSHVASDAQDAQLLADRVESLEITRDAIAEAIRSLRRVTAD